MKPLVIYHKSCADGFAAAFAAWLKFGDDAEYVPMQYGFGCKDLPAISGREVYMLDFSWPKYHMERLFRKAKRVVLLDHHKTAFEMWCGNNVTFYSEDELNRESPRQIILDNNKSGAVLTWEYFHPGEPIPSLFKHIDDYDRWQFKLEGTKEFNKAIWSYTPWTFEQWTGWLRCWGDGHLPGKESLFLAEGAAILRAHNQNVQAVVKGAAMKCAVVWYGGMESEPRWDKGLSANCPPHLTSDVGHELANQSGTYGLCWHMNNEGKVLCSLRSNGDYDVSAIAKSLGGGGHKNAAGFETDMGTLLGWLR